MSTSADSAPLALGGTTYGWLHQRSLEHGLRRLAKVGMRTTEIATAAPHLASLGAGSYERHALARLLAELRVSPVSINPGFMDINLLSTSSEFRELSERMMVGEMELAADLGAPIVVLIPGRRHTLAPAPIEACRWTLRPILDRLVARAERLGLIIGLETSPYGYLGSGESLLEIADEFDSPHLGIVYDCANVLTVEDPAVGVKKVARRLVLAHVSDTWRTRWAHTSPGRGEIDFAAFAGALREIGYRGQTIFELVDGEDPDPRLADDVAALVRAGWTLDAIGQIPIPVGPAMG